MEVMALHAKKLGFSLLELLFVLAIGAILVGVVATSYASTMQAVAVTTSADLIRDLFSEARASAVAQNMDVEVRIYNLAPTAGATPIYCALQLHRVNSDGTTPALTKILFLPQGAAIDATTTHSSLIASNTQIAPPDASDPYLNAQTRVFHFLANGATDLAPSTTWFLTVRSATQSDPAHFPANWACVRVDPVTGRPQIYRP
jgi:uncharacterized protein (TIGR02596 family)